MHKQEKKEIEKRKFKKDHYFLFPWWGKGEGEEEEEGQKEWLYLLFREILERNFQKGSFLLIFESTIYQFIKK